MTRAGSAGASGRGGPEMAPTPPTLGAPRETRDAPRSPERARPGPPNVRGPEMAPHVRRLLSAAWRRRARSASRDVPGTLAKSGAVVARRPAVPAPLVDTEDAPLQSASPDSTALTDGEAQ